MNLIDDLKSFLVIYRDQLDKWEMAKGFNFLWQYRPRTMYFDEPAWERDVDYWLTHAVGNHWEEYQSLAENPPEAS